MKLRVKAGITVALALAGSMMLVMNATATGGAAFSVTGGIDVRPLVVGPGETFLKSTFTIPYVSGTVILAGSKDGLTDSRVNDILSAKIVRPDATTAKFTMNYNPHCAGVISLPAADISSFLQVGNNVITISLRDACGTTESANNIWILP